ncbi:hypothetical protein FAIPA1_380025 [Frankia sp. AiPs1]
MTRSPRSRRYLCRNLPADAAPCRDIRTHNEPTTCADWAATSFDHRCWFGIVPFGWRGPRRSRRGCRGTERLGRHRWKIERTIAWFDGYRRLTVRYERNGLNFLGFLCLAAAITCWKKLPHPT